MQIMGEHIGKWSEVDVAGHACQVFEPARPSEHGYTVVYLHCSEAAKLAAYPAFAEEFERYGLRVIQPMSGRSWWTDRIWPVFDTKISAEGYVLQRVLPYL